MCTCTPEYVTSLNQLNSFSKVNTFSYNLIINKFLNILNKKTNFWGKKDKKKSQSGFDFIVIYLAGYYNIVSQQVNINAVHK